jgi:predicted deacetylase
MMQGYRIYLLGHDGQVSNRIEFFASDDEAAIDRAKAAAEFLEAELWHSSRLICKLPATGSD